ncbi:MAG: folate-binding protein [Acidimicrobiales bacterium]|nr:MAG: folate-binding protein [Acidimicrobiales bacterium]
MTAGPHIARGGWAAVVRADLVEVTGPDAREFLQGQLSRDVVSLAPGTCRRTLILRPDGRLGFWGRVTCLESERFLIDVSATRGEDLAARLERFRLRVACTVAWRPATCVQVRRVDLREIPDEGPSRVGDGVMELPLLWPRLGGVDLFVGTKVDPTPLVERWDAVVDPRRVEALRIAAALPGPAELREGVIPEEAGLVETSVDFSKGCYVGQELVARIQHRGRNVPRRLRVLRSDFETLRAGEEITRSGSVVGEVTSAASLPERGITLALAYLKRGVEREDHLVVGGDPRRKVSLLSEGEAVELLGRAASPDHRRR